MGKLLLTDGAKFLADQAQCYWRYDIVWSALPRLLHDSFGVVKLTMDLAKKGGGVVIEDGNDHEHRSEQSIVAGLERLQRVANLEHQHISEQLLQAVRNPF